jgi:hypothetical protein
MKIRCFSALFLTVGLRSDYGWGGFARLYETGDAVEQVEDEGSRGRAEGAGAFRPLKAGL